MLNQNNKKELSGPCDSYIKDNDGNLERCSQEGIRRYDNGLDSGIHCDECWERIIYECKQRSW